MPTQMRHWLIKSEPDVFSIDDLQKAGASPWDGVRNYQARNFMTTDMKPGDLALFYHSNAKPPGVAGVCKVAGPAAPDVSQFDKSSDYFEKRATKDKPVWFCVPFAYVETFSKLISLDILRADAALTDMAVLQKGQRLSIQPVTAAEFRHVLKLGRG